MKHARHGIAALLTVGVLLTGCGSEPAPAPAPSSASPTAPPPFTMTGTMTVGRGWFVWDEGKGCWGWSDGADVTGGASVEVLDPAGKVIAFGRLESGTDLHDPSEPPSYAVGCQYRFTVPNVPNGLVSYRVRVASRLSFPLSPSEARTPLELTPDEAAVE